MIVTSSSRFLLLDAMRAAGHRPPFLLRKIDPEPDGPQVVVWEISSGSGDRDIDHVATCTDEDVARALSAVLCDLDWPEEIRDLEQGNEHR